MNYYYNKIMIINNSGLTFFGVQTRCRYGYTLTIKQLDLMNLIKCRTYFNFDIEYNIRLIIYFGNEKRPKIFPSINDGWQCHGNLDFSKGNKWILCRNSSSSLG